MCLTQIFAVVFGLGSIICSINWCCAFCPFVEHKYHMIKYKLWEHIHTHTHTYIPANVSNILVHLYSLSSLHISGSFALSQEFEQQLAEWEDSLFHLQIGQPRLLVRHFSLVPKVSFTYSRYSLQYGSKAHFRYHFRELPSPPLLSPHTPKTRIPMDPYSWRGCGSVDSEVIVVLSTQGRAF